MSKSINVNEMLIKDNSISGPHYDRWIFVADRMDAYLLSPGPKTTKYILEKINAFDGHITLVLYDSLTSVEEKYIQEWIMGNKILNSIRLKRIDNFGNVLEEHKFDKIKLLSTREEDKNAIFSKKKDIVVDISCEMIK